MGLFGASKGGGGFNFGGFLDRLGQGAAGAQAALAGDYGAMARIGHDRRESRAAQESLAQQQRAAIRLGYSPEEVAAMNSQDLSQIVRQRLEPYSLAQGTRRYQPGVGGGKPTVTETPNPTETQRTYEFLRQQDPGLAESYLARQSLITNQGIDPSTGQPYMQAVDPRSLYPNLGQPPQKPGMPQQGQIPPPQQGQQPQPMQAPQGPQPPSQREIQLRQQAAEAIRNGADPAQVQQRLEQMLGGAGGGGGQRPFADAGRHGRIQMAESGGRDYTASGAPLTSSAGARFSMQVMPSTARAPGFGVTPAANSSPAEYNRVGREYIDAMVNEFGSEAAAAAAYNYGPGNMRDLMRRHPNNWRNHLPSETQAYLRRQGF